MIDEHQVREMLHRRANAVLAIVVDAPKAARRARRRLLANGAIAMLAAAAIAVATFTGVDAIRSAPVPADAPTPSPVSGVLRATGEVLRFTAVPHEAPGDLVAVNPQTGEERVLVENLDCVYSARWSADGRWVAYETPGPQGTGLWVASASQEPRRVATDAGGWFFSRWIWSSTGAQLATIQNEVSSRPVYSGSTLSTIDPVAGKTTDFWSIPEEIGDVTSAPTWSPDGTRIAFGARGGAVYSIDVRTGARSLLVPLPGEELDSIDQISWAPDGAHIFVMNDLEPGGGRLYVMNADGSSVRVLIDDFDPMGVAWSPDGTRLAYADAPDGPDGKSRIWVAPMDGSPATEIGGLPGNQELTWSPDGSRIAFGTAGDASALAADGSGDVERIDELTYRSWEGGWYSGECP